MKSKISKSIKYYKELKFDDLDKDDPFYKLQNYWVLDDDSIKQALDRINENVKKDNTIIDYFLKYYIIYHVLKI